MFLGSKNYKPKIPTECKNSTTVLTAILWSISDLNHQLINPKDINTLSFPFSLIHSIRNRLISSFTLFQGKGFIGRKTERRSFNELEGTGNSEPRAKEGFLPYILNFSCLWLYLFAKFVSFYRLFAPFFWTSFLVLMLWKVEGKRKLHQKN